MLSVSGRIGVQKQAVGTWKSRPGHAAVMPATLAPTVLVVFGLIVVVPGWFMALIVDRIAGSWPRRLLSRRVLLISLVAVLATGILIASFGADIHPLIILSSIPIIAFYALRGPGVRSSPDAREDDPLEQTYPRTTWRLCDPELSTGGVWRAETESYPPGLDDLGNPNLVEPYVQSLIRDWSFRSGWPYLGRQVLRISRASPGKEGPSHPYRSGRRSIALLWTSKSDTPNAAGFASEMASRSFNWSRTPLGRRPA